MDSSATEHPSRDNHRVWSTSRDVQVQEQEASKEERGRDREQRVTERLGPWDRVPGVRQSRRKGGLVGRVYLPSPVAPL